MERRDPTLEDIKTTLMVLRSVRGGDLTGASDPSSPWSHLVEAERLTLVYSLERFGQEGWEELDKFLSES